VGPADADVVEPPSVAEGDGAGVADDVGPDPVVGIGAAVAGDGFGPGGIGDRGGRPVLQRPYIWRTGTAPRRPREPGQRAWALTELNGPVRCPPGRSGSSRLLRRQWLSRHRGEGDLYGQAASVPGARSDRGTMSGGNGVHD